MLRERGAERERGEGERMSMREKDMFLCKRERSKRETERERVWYECELLRKGRVGKGNPKG